MATLGLIPIPEVLPLFPVPTENVNGLLATSEDLGLTVEEKQELDN